MINLSIFLYILGAILMGYTIRVDETKLPLYDCIGMGIIWPLPVFVISAGGIIYYFIEGLKRLVELLKS